MLIKTYTSVTEFSNNGVTWTVKAMQWSSESLLIKNHLLFLRGQNEKESFSFPEKHIVFFSYHSRVNDLKALPSSTLQSRVIGTLDRNEPKSYEKYQLDLLKMN